MDINGRRKIQQAVEAGMRYGEYVGVSPREEEFNAYEGEDRSICRYDRVRYLEVMTHGLPSVVLNSLSEEGLLQSEGGLPTEQADAGPRLRLLAIYSNNLNTLTFEDMAEAAS